MMYTICIIPRQSSRVVQFRRGSYYKQAALEIIGSPVPEEVANHQDGQDQDHNHEDLEIEIHGLTKAPAHNDHKRSIEECSLNRRSKTVVKGEILERKLAFL